jgi:hypothetical protein
MRKDPLPEECLSYKKDCPIDDIVCKSCQEKVRNHDESARQMFENLSRGERLKLMTELSTVSLTSLFSKMESFFETLSNSINHSSDQKNRIILCETCKKPLIEDIGTYEKCDKCPGKDTCPIKDTLCNSCLERMHTYGDNLKDKKESHKQSTEKKEEICPFCEKDLLNQTDENERCKRCARKVDCPLKTILCNKCIDKVHSDNPTELLERIAHMSPDKMDIITQRLKESLLISRKEYAKSQISKILDEMGIDINDLPPFPGFRS